MKKKVRIKALPKAQMAGQPLMLDSSYINTWQMNNPSSPFGNMIPDNTRRPFDAASVFGPGKAPSFPSGSSLIDVSGMPNGSMVTSADDLTKGMTPLGGPAARKPFNSMEMFGPGKVPSFPKASPSVTPLLYDEDQFNDPYGPLTSDAYYANVAQQNIAAPEGTVFYEGKAYKPGTVIPGYNQSSAQPSSDMMDLAGYVGPAMLAYTDIFANIGKAQKQGQARLDFRDQTLADNLYMSTPEGYSGNRGDYTLNYGIGLNFRPDEAVYGQFGKIAQYGGQMKRKIRITGLPQAAYGGTQNKVAVDEMYPTTDLNRMKNSASLFGGEDESVRQYMPTVPREIATVEAEKGETIVTPGQDGIPNMYKIGGKRHSQGGTPIQAGQGDFIFSDTKDMKIKDPVILESFGMRLKKGGYTPAQISKKFNLNNSDLQKTLNDPKADIIARTTAERMMDNNLSQLGKLALVQEARKGFPQGPPSISMAYMQKVGLDPSMFMPDVMTPQDATVAMGKAQDGGVQGDDWGYTPEQWDATVNANKKSSSGSSAKKSQYSDFYTYNKEALQDLLKKKIKIELPEVKTDISITPGMQRTRETGVYGTQDWSAGEYFDDFKKRNEWYFDLNPDFNPSDPSQVYDFQNKYNLKLYEEAVKAGYSEDEANDVVTKLGFKVTEAGDRDPRGTDKKFGQYTWSRSLPYIGPKEVEQTETKTDTVDDYTQEDIDVTDKSKKPTDFYIQDLLNYRQAMADRLGINKYMPYRVAIPQPRLMEPTYYDPSRELAATAETSNIAAQNLSQFTGPQAFNTRYSDVQGKAAANVANILGRYNNLNVGVANEFEKYNSALINDFNIKNALSAQDYYDKTVVANQQYDNSKRIANNRINRMFTNALTNRAMTQVLNQLYPEYFVHPLSGGMMRFMPSGRRLDGSSDKTTVSPETISKMRQTLKSNFPDMSTEAIDQYLLKNYGDQIFGSKSGKKSRSSEFLESYLNSQNMK